MNSSLSTPGEAEVAELRACLQEANETLPAIRHGEVDAVLAAGPNGDQLFTLKAADEPYRVLIEEMNEGAATLARDGSILYCNRRFAELLKRSRVEIIGYPVQTFVAPADAAGLAELLEAGGVQGCAREVTLCAGDASAVPLQLALGPLPPGSGAALCLIATDISESREKEARLREAIAAAERANAAKSDFLANMSHEIRTPMNGIIGMTGLALETELAPSQRKYLEMVKTSAHSLLGLLNDILDFSKIEAGKLELELIDFELGKCLREVVEPLGWRAAEKGLELLTEIAAEVPDRLVGDPGRLRQILVNLVDNAIKFTASGLIILKVGGREQNDGGCLLHFSVSDTGIGIPREKEAVIFEAFAQADGSSTRTYGGAGLGLAIASDLVAKMGGKIGVKSTPGEGSTFSFTAQFAIAETLPAPPAAEVSPPPPPAARPDSPPGVWCATSQVGFMRLVVGEGTSGALVRRYGLVAVVLPLLFGWLRLQGEEMGWFSTEFGSALFAIINVAIFIILIWIGASWLRTAERKERLARGELRKAHATLEGRVLERTAELAEANRSLKVQMLERFQAEHAYRQIMDHSLDVICTFDAEGRFLRVSRACEALWGYTPEELIGRPFFDLVHPDDRAKTEAIDTSILDGQATTNFENRYVRKDGSIVPMLWAANWSEEHRTNFCVARDITERKRMEESMRLLQSAVEQINESITITDAQLDWPGPKIVFVNPAHERMTGYTAAEAIGTTPRVLQGPRTDQAVIRRLRRELEDGGTFAGETVNYRKDGAEFDMEWQVAPIRDDAGKTTHFVAIQRDITARKLMETELLRSKEVAEAASRAKSEFLANMSHEIRTPMNGVLGMTDLVLDTALDREQRENLEMAKTSALSLLGLINDILDFSKIEAGRLELEAIGFSLRGCLGVMLKPLGMRADQKGLELTADISADTPDHVVGDPLRLRQILINLIDNAIKFTKSGDVMLRVNFEPGAEPPQLHFEVADTGIGIPADKQALIFEAFAQADGSTTRTYGGTGLGLAISSQLVQQMGGRLWVESVEGKGTTFHFTACLPAPSTPAPDTRPADPSALADMRVLVVDDNAVNRRILQQTLAGWRMQPLAVDSGARALSELQRAARAGAPFPLILLDGAMPGMDGFAVAKRIRDDAELSHATVLMLTSGIAAGAAARCKELGVASYLIKPAPQSELLEAILLALGRPAEAADAGHAPPAGEPRGALRILLVEDNVINRAVAARFLQRRGHSIAQAATGIEAVEAAGRERFDLIFMDVQMPGMDGFEATRRIRELEAARGGKRVVIAAMTAHAMAGDRERCLASGMDDYISKPLEKPDLLALLERVLALSPGAKSPAAAASIHRRNHLLEQLDGDEELLQQMIALSRENTPVLLNDIRAAIEAQDAGALSRSAHTLLSSLGAFGAMNAHRLARRLETLGEEQDLTEASSIFAELEREAGRVTMALEEMGKLEA